MGRKQTKSEFVSGMGIGFEIVKALSDEVHTLGGSDDDLRLILKDASLRSDLARRIVLKKTVPVEPPPSDLTWIGEVAVDYGARPSFDQLNGPWFDWVDDDLRYLVPELRSVRKDAPTTGTETARYGYIDLNRNATDEQALAEIARHKVKPATDLEAMYFGKQFPDEQYKYPIVGLGSFFRDEACRYSVVLGFNDGNDSDLILICGSDHAPWSDHDRFLVRE